MRYDKITLCALILVLMKLTILDWPMLLAGIGFLALERLIDEEKKEK